MIRFRKQYFVIKTIGLIVYNLSAVKSQIPLPTANWQNLDPTLDGVFGVSYNNTLKAFVHPNNGFPVCIAVVDGGVDITHKSLKKLIWINQHEIPGNGKDDDHNGYIDDINGWNFLGTSKESFHWDNSRLIQDIRTELKNKTNSEKLKDLLFKLQNKKSYLRKQLQVFDVRHQALKSLIKRISAQNPTIQCLEQLRYRNESEYEMLLYIIETMKSKEIDFDQFCADFQRELQDLTMQNTQVFNLDYEPRISKEFRGKYYGNPNVIGLEPTHGTHVAGVLTGNISSVLEDTNTSNDFIKIMPLTAVPVGEINDLDLASSIYYAVNNGAKIINLSFGTNYSPNKAVVDEAFKYAMDHDILIVHSSGNEGEFEASNEDFPSRLYNDGNEAKNWIEVSASGPTVNNLLPTFSNYGKETTDVFAPGVNIYSTFPNNNYRFESGTSMAAPIVSAAAAIIWYFNPYLKANQIKEIILKSVTPMNTVVKNKYGEGLNFKDLSHSGGIVNLYHAMVLARQYSKID